MTAKYYPVCVQPTAWTLPDHAPAIDATGTPRTSARAAARIALDSHGRQGYVLAEHANGKRIWLLPAYSVYEDGVRRARALDAGAQP